MKAAELLNLDPKVVRSHAEAYEGFAFAFAEKSGDENRDTWLKANYLAIAGSYWMAVDLKKGRECFRMAYETAIQNLRGENERVTFSDRVQQEQFPELLAASMAVCARVRQTVDGVAFLLGTK